MLLRRKSFWLSVVLWLPVVPWLSVVPWSGSVIAQEGGCSALARTPLEQTYCKVRAANPSAALPTLQELRRNPEKTQRLLLRRPAAQAGIELPPESSGAQPTPQIKASQARAAASPPAVARKATPARPSAATSTQQSQRPESGSLAGCEFGGTSIRCGTDRFQLQGNLPNSRLRSGALTPENRIAFAEYTGDQLDEAALMTYAVGNYLRYIEAMLDIGLGASTMSFTKFYHTLADAQGKSAGFGARLSEMFEYLKKDKATIGVQPHYNDALPDDISQCMALSDHVLVCDNVQQNWVYRRLGQ